MKRNQLFIILVSFILFGCHAPRELKKQNLAAGFENNRLYSLRLNSTQFELKLSQDDFLVVVNEDSLRSADMEPVQVITTPNTREFLYEADSFKIRVVYEIQADWTFISKQLFISHSENKAFRVNFCSPWITHPDNEIGAVLDATAGKYGKILHYKDAPTGSFFLIQNPYSTYYFQQGQLSGDYPADMKWEANQGEFPSDRACLGLYALSGQSIRHDLLPEWEFIPEPEQFVTEGIQLDYADIQAITNCARAFLLVDPQKSNKVHIGWCENDYQIDVANLEGRKEYLRILDQAAAVGAEHVLFTPNHSKYGPLENNRDAWGWENLLWLGLGQKVRSGEWVAGKDPVPADIQEMLDYAQSKGLKLMAYVYPSLPFMQDSAWTAWRTAIGQKPEHYLTVDTGLKTYQDWFVDQCIAFYEQTGISGYSFDHWWMAYEDEAGLVSSKYQQWFGTRRILEELRRRAPEILIDGRQQYHHFGTWTWLAGTYPHPMMSDEQPGSFNPFPDLSTDRISADRQRYVAYRLMVRDFTPIEILPGFITHQTQRSDANRVMRRDSYRTRDWDYLGWKYSIISTIATAPFNLVINYLPARDTAEFNHFPEESKAFFHNWLRFADQNLTLLKNIRPILGQPMVGRCDGTAAISKDQGFVFLFNPNQRELQAEFRLDQSIGLQSGEKFLLTQIYPIEGLNIGHPQKGFYDFGDSVKIQMPGIEAVVLQIKAANKNPIEPILFNAQGDLRSEAGVLQIKSLAGPIGASQSLSIFHPNLPEVKRLQVNDLPIAYETLGNLIQLSLTFDGAPFHRAQSIDLKADNGNKFHGNFTIPQRIFDQLAARKESWPVNYTDDDLLAPWTDPSRLLLFINIADPFRTTENFRMEGDQKRFFTVKEPLVPDEIRLKINGKIREVQSANNGVYPYEKRTFFGFWLDLSDLQGDQNHTLEIELPEDLAPGQFQGLFFGNIEEEYTMKLK